MIAKREYFDLMGRLSEFIRVHPLSQGEGDLTEEEVDRISNDFLDTLPREEQARSAVVLMVAEMRREAE